jgi:hypothetical protein
MINNYEKREKRYKEFKTRFLRSAVYFSLVPSVMLGISPFGSKASSLVEIVANSLGFFILFIGAFWLVVWGKKSTILGPKSLSDFFDQRGEEIEELTYNIDDESYRVITDKGMYLVKVNKDGISVYGLQSLGSSTIS